MNLEDIKNWLEEMVSLLENSKDTDDRWQKQTRRLWGKAYRNRFAIKDWVQTNKPTALPYLLELKDWIEAYFRYFEPGYKSAWSIDVLPDMIKARLTFIKEKIDSL